MINSNYFDKTLDKIQQDFILVSWNVFMVKARLKVYIETSVISGYGRERFHETWTDFFNLVRAGVFVPIISEHTLSELDDAKTPIEVLHNLETIGYTEFETTKEMQILVEKYMAKKIVIDKYLEDALHIAIATVLEVDVLVSWNLTHIVNQNTIPLFNKVNVDAGYKPIQIKRPEEIM